MRYKTWTGIAASIGMLLMILDTKTGLSGAQEGIELCMMTVIPSLLPFFLLSMLLTSSLTGIQSKGLQIIGKLLRIPPGSESIFLIGALGGYPTGAQAVSKAYTDGQLARSDARRMLPFCSNAGPAFLFGIAASSFSSNRYAWALWGIHLISAIIVGIILPGGSQRNVLLPHGKTLTVSQALQRSVVIMSQVCGWIIIFRVILSFMNRWFLWLLSPQQQILINGLTELTIGCTALQHISSEGLRFIFCAGFLGFGGVCVTMQTASITKDLGLGMYLPGKLMQCIISILLAALYQQISLPNGQRYELNPILYFVFMAFLLLFAIGAGKYEKKCSNPTAIGV